LPAFGTLTVLGEILYSDSDSETTWPAAGAAAVVVPLFPEDDP
jgi:hypothetical protein